MSNNQRNSVRIIAGDKRGSKVYFNDAPGLRPSGDRIRETLFSWLQASIVDCHCLDMFAGSGALGFEAASRGAGRVVMVEKNRTVARLLNENKQRLKFETVQVVAADALNAAAYVDALVESAGFDLVLIDPPFDDGSHSAAIEFLCEQALLRADAFVYLETAKDLAVSVPENWDLHREKVAGQVQVRLYRVAVA